jgi:hypothetical protein
MGTLNVAYGSNDKRVTGGGWIPDGGSSNGKGNFGFTVNYQKNGSPKGNSIYLYRDPDGYNYLAKSNSWQGGGLSFFKDPSQASFSGKCNVQKIDRATGEVVASFGNYSFTVDIVDGDLLNPRQTDRYAITIRDNGNSVWRQVGGSRWTLTQLGGGNVSVKSNGTLSKAAGDLEMDEEFIPTEYAMFQNYPNPFNPETQIQFDLPEDSRVKIVIYNILGRVVTTLLDEELPAGRYRKLWNGQDQFGQVLPSGIYFFRINAKAASSERRLNAVKRMLFVK